MRYTKRWSLRVVFRVTRRLPNRVTYASRWASVDYVETSATVGKKGAVSTNEVWKIEADNRILDGRECHLTLIVDPTTRQYEIESGAFDFDNASKTGQIVMSVAGRTVSEPIDKETDVIEPVRFEGSYSEGRPLKLTGEFDAHVDPPPGLDITHESLGGTVTWRLYRGRCTDALEPCFAYAGKLLKECLDFMPDVHGGRCETGKLGICLAAAADPATFTDVTSFNLHSCIEDFCSWEWGTQKFDRAVEALQDCVSVWREEVVKCQRLCP